MSPAKHLKDLRQEDFDRLLDWLDTDRERAGVIYEKIRWRLVAILASRGCVTPEEVADETIDRVARRVVDIQETYTGDKAIYFLGVMNNVHHEYLRRPSLPRLVEPDENAETKEQTHLCLDQCLDKLAPYSRQLIEKYYAENKQAKIDLRKAHRARTGDQSDHAEVASLANPGKIADLHRAMSGSVSSPTVREGQIEYESSWRTDKTTFSSFRTIRFVAFSLASCRQANKQSLKNVYSPMANWKGACGWPNSNWQMSLLSNDCPRVKCSRFASATF